MSDRWFGHFVGVHQVRRAVEDTLRLWLPTALVDVAREFGIEDDQIRKRVVFPRSWHRLADYRSPSPDQLPNITVGSPQLQTRARRAPSRPGRLGFQGAVDATWMVQVAAVVRGDRYERTADLGGIYTTAVSLVLEQQLSHHELISHVEIPSESSEQYDGAADSEARTLALGVCQALVQVEEARSVRRQALEPPDDPFDEAPGLPPDAEVTLGDVYRKEDDDESSQPDRVPGARGRNNHPARRGS